MKLNDKRTILVGLAFLSICAFWQMYDNIVPLILTRTFHMNETISGLIMAADNILAVRPDEHEDRQADAVHPVRHGLRDHSDESAAAD